MLGVHPMNVPRRIEPDISRHDFEEPILGYLGEDAHPLSLQVANASNTLIGEALEAADMQPGEQRRRIAGIDPAQRADGKILREIYRAAPDRF